MIDFAAMTLEHVAQVAAIEAASFPAPWPLRAFVQEILQNSLADYLVALREGKVAGYAGMWIILDEAHITNVAVRPELRGMGIGRRLMEQVIVRALYLGARKMTLEVRVSNAAALTLYESLGFRRTGVRPRYYEDTGEDAAIMWLDLGGDARL
ncbi:MAG: ribosomal protein S18-alanine N-acetyltransferase [Peptococcaceae bacterium]|nr:ribosomal protein S18-alanine N-acetyltransferase [Peptococcaceae bacterium]